MDLYILRHGIAEDTSASGHDRDRCLTEEGRSRTVEAGRALRKLGLELDLILSSPYLRAWQTAELIVEQLDCKKLLHRCDALSSGAPSGGVLEELKKAGRKYSSILIVGHEPDLSHLISIFLKGDCGLSIAIKKGSLCKLTCLAPEPGAGRLDWLLTSKQLCRIA